uniref:Uncharacterized protein n=1 Tax=Peronospora matthiolae TaxID=2874970 RepID=A0AAV1VHE1_9STRA
MKKPILANLKVFGCHAYVQVPQDKRCPVRLQVITLSFPGIRRTPGSYRFEEVSAGAINISRDATFMEEPKFDEGPRNYNDESSVVEFDDHDGGRRRKESKTDDDMDSSDDDNEDTRSLKSNIQETHALNRPRKLPSLKSQAEEHTERSVA